MILAISRRRIKEGRFRRSSRSVIGPSGIDGFPKKFPASIDISGRGYRGNPQACDLVHKVLDDSRTITRDESRGGQSADPSERKDLSSASFLFSLSLAFGLFRFLSKGESFSDLGKRENSAPVLTRIHCELPFRGYIRTPSFDLPSIVRRPFPTLIFAPLRPLRRGFVNLLPRVLANLGNTRGGWQGKEPLEPKLQKTRAERNSS